MEHVNSQQLSQLAKSLNGDGFGHDVLDILEDRPPPARQHEPVGAHRGAPSSTAFQQLS